MGRREGVEVQGPVAEMKGRVVVQSAGDFSRKQRYILGHPELGVVLGVPGLALAS